jgi:hypothetical protein
MSQVKNFFILLDPPADRQRFGQTQSYLLRSGRSTATLRRSFLAPQGFPILRDAGPQPFLDEPHDTFRRRIARFLFAGLAPGNNLSATMI